MHTVKLNNNVEMPILGFGVLIDDAQKCEQSVIDAINTGYRLIDTASGYLNEAAVGNGIKKSGVAREELFIATKLWIQEAGYEKTKLAFVKSLEKLQLDYLDLYMIHMPFGDVYGSWRAMEELYKEGKVRAIGVCNFQPDRLMDLMLFNEIKPAVCQIETHPFCQQSDTLKFLQDNNIQIEAWGPLAQGKNDIFNNEILVAIAGKHNKSVSQVVLRWHLQRGVVAIPKSVNKYRIEQNFQVFDFELTTEDMNAITHLDTKTTSFDLRNPELIKMMGKFKYDI